MPSQPASTSHVSPCVAAIDIGSNTIKLLVARNGLAGVETVHHAVQECRIATGISDAHPRLSEDAMRHGIDAVLALLNQARENEAQRIHIAATSAVRDAQNGPEFASRIESESGVPVHILSGEEEAQTIALALAHDPGLKAMQRFTHLDLGGGSLEYNDIESGNLRQSVSLPLGAVRLTEQWVTDPKGAFTAQDADRIANHVKSTLKQTGLVQNPPGIPIVYTGGSVTIARALVQGLPIQAKATGSPIVKQQQLHHLLAELAPRSFEQRMQFKHLPANRADVVCAALQIILSTLEYFNCAQLQHSRFSLRHGICVKLLELH
ncbi:MAG: hypothetical protein ABQ298_13415 [Puniceicoccaceae bacterium]